MDKTKIRQFVESITCYEVLDPEPVPTPKRSNHFWPDSSDGCRTGWILLSDYFSVWSQESQLSSWPMLSDSFSTQTQTQTQTKNEETK